jgi:hypothetical protein
MATTIASMFSRRRLFVRLSLEEMLVDFNLQ